MERIQKTLNAAVAMGELSLATADPESLESVRMFEVGRLREAGRRLRAEMKHLTEVAVIDAKGQRVKTGIPEDMREGTDCDL